MAPFETHPLLQTLHGFGHRNTPVEEMVASGVQIPKTHQIHSDTIHLVRGGEGVLEGDAFVTQSPNGVCVVATADCVPVLIWDPAQKVVGAIHAGWRGVASSIVPKTILFLRQFQCLPSTIVAVMGPAMGADCYEVGEEVVEACARTVGNIQSYLRPTREGHSKIDLKGILTEQLHLLGVKQIGSVDVCTHCDTRFASYRRDHSKERQYSWIQLL